MKKIIFSGLMVSMLCADFTLVYEMDMGEGMMEEVIQYRDDKNVKLFFQNPSRKGHDKATGQYIINGTRYTVVREDGKLTYMNMNKIEEVTDKLTEELNVSKDQEGEQANQKPFFKVLKKDGTRSIAGVKGEVWTVESEEDGRKYQEEIIVTINKEVVEAMHNAFEALNQFGEGPYGMDIDHDMQSMMMVADGYVLIQAKGIEFKKLDNEKIPDSVFVLPKEAVDGMENLPKMDEAKKKAGKELLKNMLE
ncbi:MAG: hypothetical protein U9Q90_07045 [Campylobacterota bacterium]|nr:hypothetical protein [Campylobacterota bacterium]